MLTSLIIREEESVWRQRVMLSKEVFIVLCSYLNHNIGQCHHHHNHHLFQVPFCQSLEVYLLPSIRDKLTALEAALACRFIIVIIFIIIIIIIIIIILMMKILSS